MKMKIQVRVLDARLGGEWPLPTAATTGAAGLDLRACIDAPLDLQPGQTLRVSSGLAVHIADPGWTGLVVPRSGLGSRHGIVLGNLVGVIDSDYQGPLEVPLWNRLDTAYRLQPGDRIAQLLLVPVAQVVWEVVTEFAPSTRGDAGFGSTGSH